MPTRVGMAAIVAALLARVASTHGMMAIGALIALAILMVLDYLASMAALHRRPITVSASRTVAVAPDGIPLTIDAPPGLGHLQIMVNRVSISANDSEFCTLRGDESSAAVVLPAGAWGASDFVRVRCDVSMLGLVSARRWVVQCVSELSLVPAPIEAGVDLAGSDDTGRLREYLPGDRMGMVSWGATARTGQIHVRAASPDLDELVVVVDLGNLVVSPPGGISMEETLGHALQLGEELLAQGRPFRLVTIETKPALDRVVRDLALATPWRRPRPKLDYRPDEELQFRFEGAPAHRVLTATVHSRDALVRRLAGVDIGAPTPRPQGPHLEIARTGVRMVR